MIDWPSVAAYLGTGALVLGFYALRTSAQGRAASLASLEERLRKLERDAGAPQMPMPRGLTGRIPG